MTTLSRVDIKKIEDYWINHKENKRQMRLRELELLHPESETDTNIGGGKSNKISDSTGRKAIVLAEDSRYQHLKNIVNTIEGLYNELDNDQRTIVNMRYWDTTECYEWQHIGDELYMSVQRVLRKRNALIDETARRLGWV